MTIESSLLTGEEETTETRDEQTTHDHPSDDETKETPESAEKDGEKDGEAEGKKDAKGDKGAPEAYDFTLPEGFELDETLIGEFEPIAKDLGLGQEAAQKLVDLYASAQQRQMEAAAEAIVRDQEQWVGELKADKDFGGDKFQESVVTARKAVEEFGSPELKEILDETGLGSHPAFVKFAHAVGRGLSEDSVSTDKHAPPAEKTPDQVRKEMYPNMPEL